MNVKESYVRDALTTVKQRKLELAVDISSNLNKRTSPQITSMLNEYSNLCAAEYDLEKQCVSPSK